MDAIAQLAGAFALFALFVHIVTTLSGLRRCRFPVQRLPAPADAAAVTIIRPVCGADPIEEQTLASTFELDYPSYEILFCCGAADDPAVPMVRQLIAKYPSVNARLLIGDDRISFNPKLNNIVKGWRAAAHEWIVLADSNVDMPRDYLQRLFAAWGDGTGLVSAPPIGWQPKGLWAEFECAYLNTYQARWQFAADSLGMGFAQGKNMLWRRRDLESGGGLQALAREPAEDAAATRVVRGLGLQVRLADGAFRQPLGPKTAAEVWRRQVRWARLRRSTFPRICALEVFSGLAAPLLGLALAAWVFEFDASDTLWAMGAYAAVWFGCEAGLAASVGWPLSWRSPFLWLLRELLLPVLVVQAWLGNSLSWRGNDWSVADDDAELGPGTLRP